MVIQVEQFLRLNPKKAFSYEEIMKRTGLPKQAVKRQVKKLWNRNKLVKMLRPEFRGPTGKVRKVMIVYFMWNELQQVSLTKPEESEGSIGRIP